MKRTLIGDWRLGDVAGVIFGATVTVHHRIGTDFKVHFIIENTGASIVQLINAQNFQVPCSVFGGFSVCLNFPQIYLVYS